MKNKLQIAMLGHKRIPSREGGIEIVVEELSTRMVELGYPVTCYNRRGHHIAGAEFDIDSVDTYKGVKLINVPTINKKGLAAVSSSIMASFKTAAGKYNVVHYHAEGSCAMLWLQKLFGKRCIVTIHGLDWDREKWRHGFGSAYIKLGERIAVKYADEIIVLSRNVQNYFLNTYSRKTIFIPNGVNRPEKCKANEIISNYGLNASDYILFLGRIVPEKGLRYLIEAFKQVQTTKKLVIAGGASDSDEFMQELKKSAKDDNRILFTGFIYGKVLEELYSNAYIYVLPSDLEGMPLSLLEAMSYGNCCVVSDISECTEVIEDKAITFKKSNVYDLKNKLQQLCDDRNLVLAYKEKATEFICNKYSWNDVVRKTLTLYEDQI